jgi:hypothetical protein
MSDMAGHLPKEMDLFEDRADGYPADGGAVDDDVLDDEAIDAVVGSITRAEVDQRLRRILDAAGYVSDRLDSAHLIAAELRVSGGNPRRRPQPAHPRTWPGHSDRQPDRASRYRR